jgi:hypothetical protein
LRTPFPVNALTVAMVLTTSIALLMAAVRLAALFPPSPGPAGCTAIALSAVAVATDAEQHLAAQADAQSKNNSNRRICLPAPHGCQAGLDKGDTSWQGKIISRLKN